MVSSLYGGDLLALICSLARAGRGGRRFARRSRRSRGRPRVRERQSRCRSDVQRLSVRFRRDLRQAGDGLWLAFRRPGFRQLRGRTHHRGGHRRRCARRHGRDLWACGRRHGRRRHGRRRCLRCKRRRGCTCAESLIHQPERQQRYGSGDCRQAGDHAFRCLDRSFPSASDPLALDNAFAFNCRWFLVQDPDSGGHLGRPLMSRLVHMGSTLRCCRSSGGFNRENWRRRYASRRAIVNSLAKIPPKSTVYDSPLLVDQSPPGFADR